MKRVSQEVKIQNAQKPKSVYGPQKAQSRDVSLGVGQSKQNLEILRNLKGFQTIKNVEYLEILGNLEIWTFQFRVQNVKILESLENLQNGESLPRSENLECLEALECIESTRGTKSRSTSDDRQGRISRNPIKRVELEKSIEDNIIWNLKTSKTLQWLQNPENL